MLYVNVNRLTFNKYTSLFLMENVLNIKNQNKFTNAEKHVIKKYFSNQHPFHLVTPSPWPILVSLNAFSVTLSAVSYFQFIENSFFLLICSLLTLIFNMFNWWRDVIRESTFEGRHTKKVQKGLRLGMILFIVSEIMFFFAFFWAFFHSSLIPTIWIGCVWPPKGIDVFNPWLIPFTNTIILLLSGASITWSHYSLLNSDRKSSIYSLMLTIFLGIFFTIYKFMNIKQHHLIYLMVYMHQLFICRLGFMDFM